jgi:mitochondrial fission protein ELM1
MQALAQTTPAQAADPAAPRVWLVLGDKPGDNAQVEIIAPALGWPYERRYVHMLPQWVKGKPRVEPSLHHLDLARSDLLEPPWPDLVMTIGRRPSMVALWIAERSGGHTKLVLVGKPSGMMERFDLVIAGAEAQLPPLPNVLAISLPLMRVDPARLAAAGDLWRERLGGLPRPLIGFLIGGPTGPFVYDDNVTERLLALVGQTVQGGGTPYLTTSRRTPAALVETLRARLPAAARLFHWAPDATDNPYLGLLALADGFVVTGDSVSMMVEIARLGRPLAILDLPTGRFGALDQARRALTRRLFAPGAAPDGLRQRVAALLHRSHLLTHTRDFRAFHRLLIERGLAVHAGQGFPPPRSEAPDDLALVVARIRNLLPA